ncbi:hypothetical protein JI435_401630, partial [Parastagonospora nodorum SN15]
PSHHSSKKSVMFGGFARAPGLQIVCRLKRVYSRMYNYKVFSPVASSQTQFVLKYTPRSVARTQSEKASNLMSTSPFPCVRRAMRSSFLKTPVTPT